MTVLERLSDTCLLNGTVRIRGEEVVRNVAYFRLSI
jgi:hypothetical protein